MADMPRPVAVAAPPDGYPPGEQPDVVSPRSGPEFLDVREDDEILRKIRAFGTLKLNQYASERSDLEERWKDSDFMFACGLDATKRATDQTVETVANTGDTLFFRQVRTLASQDLSILFSQKDPYRYTVPDNPEIETDNEVIEDILNQRNVLGRYTRKADGWDRKVIEATFSARKYGNQLFLCIWNKEVRETIEKVPSKTADVGPDGVPRRTFSWERKERVVADHPSLMVWPIEDAYIDRHIGDIQRQTCIVLTSVVDGSILHGRAAAGDYYDIDKIKPAHMYRGAGTSRAGSESGNTLKEQRELNRGLVEGEDQYTGQFELYDVFCKVPIDNDGGWDEDSRPRWFWCTFVHSIEHGPCVRAEENRDPDGEFPGYMDHVYPDDGDLAYHIGDSTVIKPNFDEKTTRKNQYFDNLSDINARTLKAVTGEVHTADLTYGKRKVVWVDSINSLAEADVRDTSQTMIGCLEYLDMDSNRALGTDRPITGQPLGGRTSASEAGNVYDAANKPHIILTKYHFLGWLDWHARKSMRLWDVFGDPDRVLRVTHEKVRQEAKLGEIYGDFDVEVTLVDEFEDNALQNQNLSFIIQSVVPQFMHVLRGEGSEGERAFLSKIFEKFHLDPSDFIPPSIQSDAELLARIRLFAMLEDGVYEPPGPGENYAVHIREAKGLLTMYSGIDLTPENISRDPRISNLQHIERYIAEATFLMEQQAAGAGVSGSLAAPPGNRSTGEVSGNAIAARSPAANVGGLPL